MCKKLLLVIVYEIRPTLEQVLSSVVKCLNGICTGLWIRCPWFKSWTVVCCGAFLAINNVGLAKPVNRNCICHRGGTGTISTPPTVRVGNVVK